MQSPRAELEHFRVLLKYSGEIGLSQVPFWRAASGAAQVLRAIFTSLVLIRLIQTKPILFFILPCTADAARYCSFPASCRR